METPFQKPKRRRTYMREMFVFPISPVWHIMKEVTDSGFRALCGVEIQNGNAHLSDGISGKRCPVCDEELSR
jgi:hypothetical protein